jgi:hypothetical protein
MGQLPENQNPHEESTMSIQRGRKGNIGGFLYSATGAPT